jgi:RNA polymerase sigma-70 factor, ECF subfamily
VSAVDLRSFQSGDVPLRQTEALGASEPPGPENRSDLGSGPAFRKLYDEHVSMAWRGLLRLGVPEALVEDAVQDVFLVVHRRDGDFAARSSVKTWIYGIVVRVAKDYRRSVARQRRRLSEVERLSGDVERPMSPAEHAEQVQAARLVNAVLSRLSDSQREVIVLVELMGLSTKEAAEVLGTSLRTCQRLLGQARELFDRFLAEMTIDDQPRLDRGVTQ